MYNTQKRCFTFAAALSLVLAGGLHTAARAQSTFITGDNTISTPITDYVYVGINALPPAQTINASPTVGIVNGGSVGRLYVWNSSTINLNGGSFGSGLEAFGTSTINLNTGTAGPMLYAYNSSTVNFNGGSISDTLYAYHNSTVNFNNGSALFLVAFTNNNVTMSGGNIRASVYAYYDSTVNLSGGSVSQGVWARDSSTVNFRGAAADYLSAGGSGTIHISSGSIGSSVWARDNSTINFYGAGLSTVLISTDQYGGDFSLYMLSGKLLDGTDVTGKSILVQNGSNARFFLNNVAADAGTDQTVAVPHDGDPSTNTASVTLSGSASGLPAADTVTYAWYLGGTQIASGATMNQTLTPGTYTFTLKASSALGATVTDEIQITVNPEPNQAPTADARSVSTNEDTAVSLALTGNDLDGDSLHYVVASQPVHGTLSGTAPNLIYTPAANYNGSDAFTITVTDPYGASSTATVSITVNPINDAPVAVSDTATTRRNTTVTIAVLANDTDVEGDALTIASVTQPASGTVVKNTNGTVTFTPKKGFTGTTSFTYTITDSSGAAATATVIVTVTR